MGQIGKRLAILLTLVVLLVFVPAGYASASKAASEPVVTASAAVLLEQQTGELLYSKEPTARMFPASLTKLLTALVVLEYGGNLDELVPVGRELWLVKPGSSRAGLQFSDQISLRNLLFAMLLPSGNDAAYVAAVHTGRQQLADASQSSSQALERFVALMNQQAQALGATDSRFVNPDGYHHPNHYSTALDLAKIARAVLQDEFLRQIVAQDAVKLQLLRWGRPAVLNLTNTNRLLDQSTWPYYPRANGLKTGTTKEAGRCLAASARNDELEVVAIVLGSSELGRWQDARSLLDFGLDQHQLLPLATVGEQVQSGRLTAKLPGFYREASLVSAEAAKAVVRRADAGRVVSQFVGEPALVRLQQGQITLSSKAQNGTRVGQQVFSLDGRQLAAVPIAVEIVRDVYLPTRATVLGSLAVIGLLVAYLGQQAGRRS